MSIDRNFEMWTKTTAYFDKLHYKITRSGKRMLHVREIPFEWGIFHHRVWNELVQDIFKQESDMNILLEKEHVQLTDDVSVSVRIDALVEFDIEQFFGIEMKTKTKFENTSDLEEHHLGQCKTYLEHFKIPFILLVYWCYDQVVIYYIDDDTNADSLPLPYIDDITLNDMRNKLKMDVKNFSKLYKTFENIPLHAHKMLKLL